MIHLTIFGILPDSIADIFEEAAEVLSFKFVSNDFFRLAGLHECMLDIPVRYFDSSE